MNKLSTQSRLRRIAANVLVATLLIRALLPLGYMPGNLLAGEFAALCPVASTATFQLLGLGETPHHHHAAEDAESFSVATACPIGSSLFFDALPAVAVTFEPQALRPAELEIIHSWPALSVAPARQWARAPPFS